MRFLFSGSREWVGAEPVARVIAARMSEGDVLIHGGAEGLDWLVGEMWKPFGPVEVYEAKDFPDPLTRNLHMISLGADECHAFALKWKSGTGHCARHARLAGIPTFDHGVDTRVEVRG
jgi:hypothetical protein